MVEHHKQQGGLTPWNMRCNQFIRTILGHWWIFQLVGNLSPLNGFIKSRPIRTDLLPNLKCNLQPKDSNSGQERTLMGLMHMQLNTTLHTITTIVSHRSWPIFHLDIKITFLNRELSKEVFIKQPEGFRVQGQEQKVCKLLKALYKLRQVLQT